MKRVQIACKRNNVKVKVIEKMKTSVKRELQKSNPYGWMHCGRHDCVTCNRGIRVNCRTRGSVYQIDCVECRANIEKQYKGQTGRSLYERMKEHLNKWRLEEEDSCLHKHSVENHNGEEFKIDVKIVAQCFGKPTTRLITEAVHIEEMHDENSLNSKSEWNYVQLPRVEVA